MAQSRNDNIQTNAPKPVDNRTGKFTGGLWTLFTTPEEALADPIVNNWRHIGMTIPIDTEEGQVEYWFDGGVEDEDFVLKTVQQGVPPLNQVTSVGNITEDVIWSIGSNKLTPLQTGTGKFKFGLIGVDTSLTNPIVWGVGAVRGTGGVGIDEISGVSINYLDSFFILRTQTEETSGAFLGDISGTVPTLRLSIADGINPQDAVTLGQLQEYTGGSLHGNFTVNDTGQAMITIPHGLGAVPTFVNVFAPDDLNTRNLLMSSIWTADATNITITPQFLNNDDALLKFTWEVKI